MKSEKCKVENTLATAASCSPHNNAADHVNTTLPDGRISVSCRRCGKWIGYREQKATKAKEKSA